MNGWELERGREGGGGRKTGLSDCELNALVHQSHLPDDPRIKPHRSPHPPPRAGVSKGLGWDDGLIIKGRWLSPLGTLQQTCSEYQALHSPYSGSHAFDVAKSCSRSGLLGRVLTAESSRLSQTPLSHFPPGHR